MEREDENIGSSSVGGGWDTKNGNDDKICNDE